jgi:predicted protein tyrosine phosphatase
MSIKSVSFISQFLAERLDPLPNAAMISIANPGETVTLREGWASLLRVGVADSSYDEETIGFFGRMWWVSSYGFPAKVHALAIREFLDGLSSASDTLIVHCGAGVSRSAAVAKYAAERYQVPFPDDYHRHNEALYRLLVNPCVFDAALAPYPKPRPSGWRRLFAPARRLGSP